LSHNDFNKVECVIQAYFEFSRIALFVSLLHLVILVLILHLAENEESFQIEEPKKSSKQTCCVIL